VLLAFVKARDVVDEKDLTNEESKPRTRMVVLDFMSIR